MGGGVGDVCSAGNPIACLQPADRGILTDRTRRRTCAGAVVSTPFPITTELMLDEVEAGKREDA